ncbi:MAG TPA: hypothetical protein VG742_14065 [Dongiaceae bacterium]|nr:hypothetical protein [Dongiaceae bacterium]
MTRRNAAKPLTTCLDERRDHKVAHKLSGRFTKVSVGAGGN